MTFSFLFSLSLSRLILCILPDKNELQGSVKDDVLSEEIDTLCTI